MAYTTDKRIDQLDIATALDGTEIIPLWQASKTAFTTLQDVIDLTVNTFSYDATIDFTVNVDPNTVGTIFSPNTPHLTTKIYVSAIDGSQWTWNGTAYVLYIAPFWSKTGNSGTTLGIDFMGTTDDKDVLFKRNGIQAGTFIYNSTLGLNEFSTYSVSSLYAFHQSLTITSGINPSVNKGTFNPVGLSGTRVWIVPDASGTLALTENTWGITGNSGTTPGTNFIGTTDNKDIYFKRNNIYVGKIGGTSIGFGTECFNSGVMSSFHNTGMGWRSFYVNTTGTNNSGFGAETFQALTTGIGNTAIGQGALFSLLDGDSNCGLGSQSLATTTTGNYNVGVGYGAGLYNTTASNQIFINSLNRNNYTGDQTKSPIYIQQNATMASQLLRFNGLVGINTIPSVALDVVGDVNTISGTNNLTVNTSTWNLGDGYADAFSGIGGDLVSHTLTLLADGGTQLQATSAGITIASLSGTGTRAVFADASGILSSPDIPQYATRTLAMAGGLTAGMFYSLPIVGDNKVICVV